MAGYGEQEREWQEMRGEQEPGQVGLHRPDRAWILFRALGGWSVIPKAKLGSNRVKRDPPATPTSIAERKSVTYKVLSPKLT